MLVSGPGCGCRAERMIEPAQVPLGIADAGSDHPGPGRPAAGGDPAAGGRGAAELGSRRDSWSTGPIRAGAGWWSIRCSAGYGAGSHTGPLTVRTTDPFGLVQLDRQFVATSEVMVTPRVVPLPHDRAAGGARQHR